MHDPLIRQETELVFLTNRIGEICNVSSQILVDVGQDSGGWGGRWYPLTKKEQDFVLGSDKGFVMPSGFLAVCAYTALHAGKKWLVTAIEYTDEEAVHNNTIAQQLLDKMNTESSAVRPAIEHEGGKLFLFEHALEEGHTMDIAFPLDVAITRFQTGADFVEWLRQLAGGERW